MDHYGNLGVGLDSAVITLDYTDTVWNIFAVKVLQDMQ